MTLRRRLRVLLAAAAVLAAACGDRMAGDGMGDGDALGGSARTEIVAEVTLDELPDAPLAWTAFEVAGVEHRHAGAFVHALEDTTVTVDGEEHRLAAGAARWVPADAQHTHGDGTAWDVLLAAPGVPAPDGAAGDARFTSGALEGLPDGEAELVAALVTLPPGSRTSVHTHPGPEFIHVTRGSFVYENELIGPVEANEGDGHAIARDIAVQKRNAEDGDAAAFLSWFVVDPDAPFASEASFDG